MSLPRAIVEPDSASILPVQHTRASDVAAKVALAGTSNAMASCGTNVFDLLKVRQQLQGGTSSSFVKLGADLFRQEGILGIWKGLSASALREMTYSGLRMGCYDPFKHGLFSREQQTTFYAKLVAGICSGILGSAIANPFDLMKVRMQSVGNTLSLSQHFRSILMTSGVKGFYRAVGPTMTRASILTSSQLGSYDHAKQILSRRTGSGDSLQSHIFASGIAGLTCTCASAPVDVVKVRMMKDQAYANAIQCTYAIVRNDGPLALYKGFFMCFMRLWPHTVISLLLFEKLRSLSGFRPVGQQ